MEGFNCSVSTFIRDTIILTVSSSNIEEAITDIGSNRPTAYSASTKLGGNIFYATKYHAEFSSQQIRVCICWSVDLSVCQSVFNASAFWSARDNLWAYIRPVF